MNRFFNINYEFDHDAVHNQINTCIKRQGKGYICVADGVILNIANRDESYRRVLDGAMFSICDSSYVPLYIKWIHGTRYPQYCGSQIFRDIVSGRRHRMAFLGTQQKVLDGLRRKLSELNPAVDGMLFHELPFLEADEFDFPAIARMLEDDGADIIWVALGAPKQEIFMHNLLPHLSKGVMIAVGAAFRFFSGEDVDRAPKWMVDHHMEFVHRIIKEPRKQIVRCGWIVRTLPGLLRDEYRRKNKRKQRNFRKLDYI